MPVPGEHPAAVWARGLALALAGAVLLTGCGGDDKDPPAQAAASQKEKAESVGRRSAGSVVQFADCDDWRRGSRAEREVTVVELRDQLTIQSARSSASPLPDDRAYEIFQKACKPDFAGSLRLYKLYARAQGFAPLNE